MMIMMMMMMIMMMIMTITTIIITTITKVVTRKSDLANGCMQCLSGPLLVLSIPKE